MRHWCSYIKVNSQLGSSVCQLTDADGQTIKDVTRLGAASVSNDTRKQITCVYYLRNRCQRPYIILRVERKLVGETATSQQVKSNQTSSNSRT